MQGTIACQRNIKEVNITKQGTYFRNGPTKRKDILKKCLE